MFDCLQQEKLEVSVFVRLETILEVHPMDSTIKIKFKGTLWDLVQLNLKNKDADYHK